MGTGRKLKTQIIGSGLKCWDISVKAGIHYSRFSAIINDKIAPSLDETQRIKSAIIQLAGSDLVQIG